LIVVLQPILDQGLDLLRRDDHHAVDVAQQDVARKHRDPADLDRLVDVDRHQGARDAGPVYTSAKDRQADLADGANVAHRAVDDDAGPAACLDATGVHVARHACLHASAGVDHEHLARLDRLDGDAMRALRHRVVLRLEQILAQRQKAQRACAPDHDLVCLQRVGHDADGKRVVETPPDEVVGRRRHADALERLQQVGR
jgi:hypothetical protein